MVLALVLGCGDGDEQQPLVAEMAPAIAAIETALGGPQDYFEINATPQVVNLWVATDEGSTATVYAYLDGELQPPAPARGVAAGETFRADALDFDPDTIFTGIADQLGEPTIAQFVVVGGPDGAVQYSAFVTSDEGGVLDVLLAPDGAVLSTEAA